MKKKSVWGITMAVILAAGSLSACGGSGASPATQAPQSKENQDNQGESGDPAPAAVEAKELSWYVGEPETHAWSQVSYDIAKEIEEKTGGSITIKVYPGATLGTQAEALDMLRTGSLAFEISGPSILASFCDQVQVYSLPYAFDDAEQAYA